LWYRLVPGAGLPGEGVVGARLGLVGLGAAAVDGRLLGGLESAGHVGVLEELGGHHRPELAAQREVARVELAVRALLGGHVEVRVALEHLGLDAPELELEAREVGQLDGHVGVAQEGALLVSHDLGVEPIDVQADLLPEHLGHLPIDVGHVHVPLT